MAAVDALDEVLRRAVRVRVVEGGPGPERGALIDSADPAALRELREALAVERVTDGSCMCRGELGFVFDGRGGERLAVVGFHHATSLRWSGWDGDALLRDGTRVLRWLAGRGVAEPLTREQERQGERSAAREARERWIAAAPASVRDLLPLAVDTTDAGGVLPQGVSELVDRRLAEAVPDPVERTAALLRWYGSGTGRFSGFPVHEALPERALAATPVERIAGALRAYPADPGVAAGALRHLCGWKSRKHQARDVAWIPVELRDRLVAAARDSGDEDRLRRARRVLGG